MKYKGLDSLHIIVGIPVYHIDGMDYFRATFHDAH